LRPAISKLVLSYTGHDGIERNTRFNTCYVFNLLCGKEWALGTARNKIPGVNARVNFMGGKRTTPVDADMSAISEDVVSDYSRLYKDREPAVYYNYRSQQVERFEFAVPVPNLSYKIEFSFFAGSGK
jgi:hypothetical protein